MGLSIKFLSCILLFYLIIAVYAFCYILSAQKRGQTHSPLLIQRSFLRSTAKSLRLRDEHQNPVDLYETEEEKRYWNQWSPVNYTSIKNISPDSIVRPMYQSQPIYTVDIWSNNGLGTYLWEHILQGELKPVKDLIYSHGEKIIDKVRYRYKGSEKLNAAFLPDSTDNMILVLNGRDNITASTAKSWLDSLSYLDLLQNVGLVMIGDELCRNDWLLPYLHQKNSSSLKFVFLVYDCPCVDDQTIYQFPLGVATYRNFPLASYSELVVPAERQYICNFMATVYPNSSRETLFGEIAKLNNQYSKHICYMKIREKWQPEETHSSLQSYLHILKTSDLTLCPIGKNSESYRIYEAMSMGSVPVIEDVSASPSCDTEQFRLLKKHKAPVIFIKSWKELHTIIATEQSSTEYQKQRRRLDILTWYKHFRKEMAIKFTNTVEQKFFSASMAGQGN